MKIFARIAALATLLPALTVAAVAQDTAKLNERLSAATGILKELARVPDKGIPDNIAKKAHCVIVVPSFKKGAFIGGAQYGQGVATCYVSNKGWSAPVFVQMAGVSFGLQIGAKATDLVLVGVTNESATALLKAKVKLGGDIAAVAGPVGRDSQAATTELANAAFLTYSRSKGLFGGINLSGDEVNQNQDDTKAFYGKDIPFETTLNGGTPTPASARPFVREVTRVFGGPTTRK